MPESTSRELLAERLMEEAENSSEAAIRAAFSRAYYALHHLGIALTGEKNHAHVRDALQQRNSRLGEEYGYFLILRSQADYETDFVQKRFGDLNGLRLGFRENLERARELFERLREELSSHGKNETNRM